MIFFTKRFTIPKKTLAERCQNYVPNWQNFIECYGVVVITDAWDEDYLSLSDHVHNYEIARIHNQDQYRYINGKLYVINKKYIENSSSNNIKITYYQKLFQNNKLNENPYDFIYSIPTYLVIDTQSGEVKAYKNIDKAPQLEQGYFRELEGKQ